MRRRPTLYDWKVKYGGIDVPEAQARPNASWSLDFVYDQFASGRRFRILNIVDDVTRECLAAIPDTSPNVRWRGNCSRSSKAAANKE
jgi:transposase InsO family protein